MLECEVCGTKFNAIVEKHYIARDNGKTGLTASLGVIEGNLYDAFDCPMCGSQVIAKMRKRSNYIPLINNEENDDVE